MLVKMNFKYLLTLLIRVSVFKLLYWLLVVFFNVFLLSCDNEFILLKEESLELKSKGNFFVKNDVLHILDKENYFDVLDEIRNLPEPEFLE